MQEDKIQTIATDVKKFLSRETNNSAKINEIEDKINKMNNMLVHPPIDHFQVPEEKSSLEDYIRKGVISDFVTKSYSGADAEGGVLLTHTISQKIISRINALSPMRQLASVESISTRALDVIIEDGDLGAGWVAETRGREDTDTSRLIKKTIPVHELYAQPKATQALINDSEINIENWLADRLVDNFIRLENKAFISGDGNDKPTGLITNNQVESIEIGENITFESLLKLVGSLDEGYRANASFLMNRATLSMIQSLKDDNGRFIWQQSLTDPLEQSIFGVPVVISSDMPEPEAGNTVIAIGDFKSAYKIVDRVGMHLLKDPYTDKPYVRFYAVKRVGGDVVNPKAMLFAKLTEAEAEAEDDN